MGLMSDLSSKDAKYNEWLADMELASAICETVGLDPLVVPKHDIREIARLLREKADNENKPSATATMTLKTWEHIHRVQELVGGVVRDLLRRAEKHDQSKLHDPEVEVFGRFTPRLAETTFDSPEYKGYKKSMRVALDHHYANNRHHPEHFKNGVEDMNLIDVLEMLLDWKAASERHNDGNIRKSIEANGERFEISPQLIRIMENTVDYLGNATVAWGGKD